MADVDVFISLKDPPVLTLPNEINAGEVTQVRCSVRFGLLPSTADAVNRIQVSLVSVDRLSHALIGHPAPDRTPASWRYPFPQMQKLSISGLSVLVHGPVA